MQIHTRRATRDDISFVAWCNFESTSPAPGFSYWDPLLAPLQTDTMTFIKTVFAYDALAWGRVENFFIVEESGIPVGGASGFTMDEADYRPLRMDRLPDVARALGWDAGTMAQFLHGYESVWNDPHDATLAPTAHWIIECVAVVPEARGRGVAKTLLRAILDEGRRLGHTRAGISVTIDNEPAKRVYEALGFQTYMLYGAEYFEGQYPGTIKYRMNL
jgi:ribosomal protein S18 acetylase RimI-like enzyme